MLKIAIQQEQSPGGTSRPVILKEKKDFINLIRSCIRRNAAIDTVVSKAIGWEHSPQGSDSSGSDEEKKAKETYNHTRRQGKQDVDNYAKQPTDVSPTRLAQDAQEIHAKLPQNDFSKRTTVLCVALKNKEGSIKKFVFCNADLMPVKLRDYAEHELGYHVIHAGQSHAEGEFLQFLWKRQTKRTPEYTHLVSIGCSKRHCQDCDLLLQLVLGKNYHKFTAAVDDHNKVVVREEAVDTEKQYRNYYISEDLQEVIAALTGTQLTCEGRYWSPTRSQQKAKSTSQQGAYEEIQYESAEKT